MAEALMIDDEERELPPETIFRCVQCGENIRFGDICSIVWDEGKYAFVHARCYGDWIAKEGR